MSAQLISFLGDFKTYVPWISFVAGIGGSFHCVGMCGGLATASCEKSNDVFRYQGGRLIGYLLLGTFAGSLGSLLNIASIPAGISLIPAIFIGAFFIYWGVLNFFGKKSEFPAPKFLGKIYAKLFQKLVRGNLSLSRAFFTGLISILLPCGLLYGIVLGTVALQNTTEAILSVFFFWLGTVPSMVLAPSVFQKILKPLRSKLPKTYALSLVAIGILTITFRVARFGEAHAAKNSSQGAPETHRCH